MFNTPRVSRQGVRILLFWLVTGFVVLLDQSTKAAVRVSAPETGYIGVFIPHVLDLVHVENTGAAFSIGQGAGGLFIVVAIIAIGSAFALVCTEDIPLSLTASLACVAGGGAGNMMDRVMRGSVTDFFATSFMDFPVFNVADIFVTCGVAVCFVLYVIWSREAEATETTEGPRG